LWVRVSISMCTYVVSVGITRQIILRSFTRRGSLMYLVMIYGTCEVKGLRLAREELLLSSV